jgi:hypothetical protein
LIELVYRSPRISLPKIGFVCVDGHKLTLPAVVENATRGNT